jgi:site-specific DNA recombinase
MSTSIERAIPYTRVSSDDTGNDSRNLFGQLQTCHQYIEWKGYQVVDELVEDERGVSGADMDAPQLQKAIEMAQAGEYDVLVCRSVDRLARNLEKQLAADRLLKQAGVRIEYVWQQFPDDEYGDFNKHVSGAMFELERKIIYKRTMGGKRRKIKEASHVSSSFAPYGYRLEKYDRKTSLAVVEDEARIIEQIFNWYLNERLTVRTIAKKLTRMRVPTYTDTHYHNNDRKIGGYGEWSVVMVYTILRNQTYKGEWVFSKNNQPIVVEVPAIIDPKTWNAAERKRQRGMLNSPRNTKHEYLMAKRLKCICGYGMSASPTKTRGKTYLYYVPYHVDRVKYPHVTCPENRTFRAPDVDHTVWQWVKNLTSDPGYIADLYKEHKAAQETHLDEFRSQLTDIDARIHKNQIGLDRLLKMLWDEADPESENLLLKQKTVLQEAIADLKQQQQQLLARLEQEAISNDDIVEMTQYLTELNAALTTGGETFQERRQVVEELDVRGVLYRENGDPLIDISSVIATENAVPVYGCGAVAPYTQSDNLILLLPSVRTIL